jgi:hypothetical protein
MSAVHRSPGPINTVGVPCLPEREKTHSEKHPFRTRLTLELRAHARGEKDHCCRAQDNCQSRWRFGKTLNIIAWRTWETPADAVYNRGSPGGHFALSRSPCYYVSPRLSFLSSRQLRSLLLRLWVPPSVKRLGPLEEETRVLKLLRPCRS